MTRFRENKMETQNFKKSFRIEIVERSSPNLVGLWGSWAYMLSQNLRSIRPEMDFWRIFENFEKKSFQQNGASSPGQTGSDINMRISLLETRNIGACDDEPFFRYLFPLPVCGVSKSKKSKSHFFKTGQLGSHTTAKPEAVFIRSLRRLTEDGQHVSEQKIACRYSFKRI